MSPLPLQPASPSSQYGQPPAALAFQTQGAHVLLWEQANGEKVGRFMQEQQCLLLA